MISAEKNFYTSNGEVISKIQKNDEKRNNSDRISVSLMFSLKNSLEDDLPKIFNCIKQHDGDIQHMETRSSRQGRAKDVFMKLIISEEGFLRLIQNIRQETGVSITILNDELVSREQHKAWYPKDIDDLNKCTHLLDKLEPDLDKSHPGFNDPIYRARRAEITSIAFEYKQGDVIPRIDYTDEEIKTWSIVFNKLRTLYPKYACRNYLKVLKMLEEECGYRSDNIPQLQDVSLFLKKKSGFVLRPAGGLVKARDFLASLAFRVFQCTQYVRHSSSPEHTPEPDCIHELLGHVPMLADLEFAKFSQEIGLASLGASDQDIEHLATVYWFTVEFGLCKEGGQIKAYGAGLLSSYGELQHAVSGIPNLLPFDPMSTSLPSYQDQSFQDVYFVAETFQNAKEKIRNYVRKKIRRPCDVIYDPYTQCIQELDSLSQIEEKMEDIAANVRTLKDAMKRLHNKDDII